jgi:hypothetical protein
MRSPQTISKAIGDLKSGKFQLPYITGTWYYVDAKDGSSGNDGMTPDTAVASLETAYGLCTTGVGDGIVIISRSISGTAYGSNLTATIAWSKYGITVVGVAAPGGYFGRARVTHAAAYDTMEHLIYITGQNNRFYNIMFYNNPENDGDPVSATAVVSAVKLGGPRNYFENCHFNCTPQSANAYKSDLNIAASADECRFVDCFFGSSSFDVGNNASCWVYLGAAAAQIFFEDCTFLAQASAGTAFGAVKSGAATTLNGLMLFKRCFFGVWRASVKGALSASWFIGTNPTTGSIGLMDPLLIGFTALDAQSANDTVWTNLPAAANTGGIGVAV